MNKTVTLAILCAAIAYDKAALIYFGNNAKLNFEATK